LKALLFAFLASSFAGGAMAAPEVMGPPQPVGPQPPQACAALETRTVAPDGVPLLKRLDQLPEAVRERAVWRTVEGCPVREVRYEGQTWYVITANPMLDSRPLQGSRIRRYDAH
jgi:hypothetical protein